MDVKTFEQLTAVDPATRATFVGGGDLLTALQEQVAALDLVKAVPEDVRRRWDRCRKLFVYGYFANEFFAVAAEQAWLTIEQAVRMRLQEFSVRAAHIHAADNGLPPFNRPRPISLQNLLEMAVADDLLSHQWPIDAICARRNWFEHGRETALVTPPMAQGTFDTVAALVNELWGSGAKVHPGQGGAS